MDNRERIRAAVELRRPDRCPILHSALPGAFLKWREGLIDIFKRYPHEFGPSEFTVPNVEALAPDYRRGVYRDLWGTVWRSEVDGIHGQVYDYPVKDWADLESYRLPPLPSRENIEKTKRWAEDLRSRGYFVIGSFDPHNLYERMQWLRGFHNLLRDFVKRPKELYAFADMLVEYGLQALERALEARPDMVSFADDWGTQQRLMVRPEFWREFFKPRYRLWFKLAHDEGAYVYFHSDGYIMDIIPDLYEAGVNVLNPQFSCHRLEQLADVTRGRLCVSSDVDRQYILPRGTPVEVDGYVKRIVELFGLGNDGGLIGRGEASIDTPLENIEAMYRAFRKYGEYRWEARPPPSTKPD
ncbi:MAG: uroporphyrinogen decarboxylase family protein [Candidatus Bathyarchaeia archaeon]